MDNNVLILDDDSELTAAMAEIISLQTKRRTLTATSFADLQNLGDKIHTSNIAFIDVNLGLDQPNGIVAAKWLREQGFKGRMYFFTGHAGNHPLVLEASTLTGVDIVHKPIDLKNLFALLNGSM
jgi:DNA-binding NtrC family response regulator